jgi:hypothetical protein
MIKVALPRLSDLDARIVTTAEPWVRRRFVCIQLPGGLGAGRWRVRMRQNGQIGRSLSTRSTGSHLDGHGVDDLPGRLEHYEVRAHFSGSVTGLRRLLNLSGALLWGVSDLIRYSMGLTWEYSSKSVRFLYREVDIWPMMRT